MESVCVVDFESVKSPNGDKSIVYTATVERVDVYDNGDVLCRPPKTFFNTDIYTYIDEYGHLYSERDLTHIKNKVWETGAHMKRMGKSVIELGTLSMIKSITRVIWDNGAVWVGHSIDRDMKALYDTDEVLNTKTAFFKCNPIGNDDVCTQSKAWPKIAKVCTQMILPYRAPNFMEFHKTKCTTNLYTLQNLCKTVYDDPNYVQEHISTHDVDDLIELIRRAKNMDNTTFYIGTQNAYRL